MHRRTLASYELALQQGADSMEQDLHVTKDDVPVCLHDRTLERTTRVREVCPGRGRAVTAAGKQNLLTQRIYALKGGRSTG